MKKNLATIVFEINPCKTMIYRRIIYLIFFLFFFFLAYNVPYCHDEWQWGLPERIELMKNGFENYNGRYLGNILALLITRSVWLKALILAIFELWLLFIISQTITKSTAHAVQIFLQLFSVFLLLALPKTLFSQSYGWPAAFVNFVPPVVLFLVYYNLTEQTYWSANPHYKLFATISVLPLGFATQLFSEHITVFTVIYALWMTLLCIIRYKKIHLVYLNYLIGTIAGAFLMFSNGAYHNAATGKDGYKHIGFSINILLEQFRTKLWDNLLLNNWILNILIAVSLTYFIGRKEKNRLISTLLEVILLGYCTYAAFHRIYPSWNFTGNEIVNEWIEVFLSLMFVTAILLSIWRCVHKKRRSSICILYFSSICVALPLLAANPIGPRCFFVSYIFQAIVLIALLNQIFSEAQGNLFTLNVCILTAVLTVGIIYLRMFSVIGNADRYRAQLITSGINNKQTEITLPLLPYSDYYWTTVPVNETWERRFKDFYHIPQNITLNFQ